jgi:CDP-diacylglycerol--glycerol-3-phosphate 3-phosphatidyltransferase
MNFQKKQIPNILTILRILILPILIGIFIAIACDCDTIPIYSINAPKNVVWQHNLLFLISGILFTIASFTDLLDGYLARKYKWVSDFGKLWDPIADKILVNTTLIFFAV